MTVKSIAALILGGVLAANGVVMLGWPADWYMGVPGVTESGPFNSHFIRDIGIVHVIAGASAAWTARHTAAWPAAMAGAAFLCAHALFHLIEAAGGHLDHRIAVSALPPILIMAAVGLWVAWPPRRAPAGER